MGGRQLPTILDDAEAPEEADTAGGTAHAANILASGGGDSTVAPKLAAAKYRLLPPLLPNSVTAAAAAAGAGLSGLPAKKAQQPGDRFNLARRSSFSVARLLAADSWLSQSQRSHGQIAASLPSVARKLVVRAGPSLTSKVTGILVEDTRARHMYVWKLQTSFVTVATIVSDLKERGSRQVQRLRYEQIGNVAASPQKGWITAFDSAQQCNLNLLRSLADTMFEPETYDGKVEAPIFNGEHFTDDDARKLDIEDEHQKPSPRTLRYVSLRRRVQNHLAASCRCYRWLLKLAKRATGTMQKCNTARQKCKIKNSGWCSAPFTPQQLSSWVLRSKRSIAISAIFLGSCSVILVVFRSPLASVVTLSVYVFVTMGSVARQSFQLTRDKMRSSKRQAGEGRCQSYVRRCRAPKLFGPGNVMWMWASTLSILPCQLMAMNELLPQAQHVRFTPAQLGVLVYFASMWTLGWGFLWFRNDGLKPVEKNQHLVAMPNKLLLQMKLVTVLTECYNYCGFSFFPALPWSAVEVPPNVPSPQAVMLAGWLNFGNADTFLWIFISTAAIVALSFISLFLTRKDIARRLLVIQIFFDLLSFPVLKKMTSVFSCTTSSVWVKSDGVSEKFCDLGPTPKDGTQCLDDQETLVCWEGKHTAYVLTTMLLIVPYYLATLDLQTKAQARLSVVAIDGVWNVVALQTKFLLSAIASNFGTCFPRVMVVCVEVAVVSQLFMLYKGKIYSSVLTMNALRLGGLLMAAVNGAFAAFILWYYRNDPLGTVPCTDFDATPASSGSGPLEQKRLVNSYAIFFGLLVVNGAAIAYSVVWFFEKRKDWVDDGDKDEDSTDFASVNRWELARETDYPIVKSRLDQFKLEIQNNKRFKLWWDHGCELPQPGEDRPVDDVADVHKKPPTDCQLREGALACGLAGARPDFRLQPAAHQALRELLAEPPLDWRGEPDLKSTLAALTAAAGSNSLSDSPGNAFVFDLNLLEDIHSGELQQLEGATLDLVLESELLADPFGVNLIHLDFGQPSGLLVHKLFQKIHKGKKKLKARILRLNVTNLGTKNAGKCMDLFTSENLKLEYLEICFRELSLKKSQQAVEALQKSPRVRKIQLSPGIIFVWLTKPTHTAFAESSPRMRSGSPRRRRGAISRVGANIGDDEWNSKKEAFLIAKRISGQDPSFTWQVEQSKSIFIKTAEKLGSVIDLRDEGSFSGSLQESEEVALLSRNGFKKMMDALNQAARQADKDPLVTRSRCVEIDGKGKLKTKETDTTKAHPVVKLGKDKGNAKASAACRRVYEDPLDSKSEVVRSAKERDSEFEKEFEIALCILETNGFTKDKYELESGKDKRRQPHIDYDTWRQWFVRRIQQSRVELKWEDADHDKAVWPEYVPASELTQWDAMYRELEDRCGTGLPHVSMRSEEHKIAVAQLRWAVLRRYLQTIVTAKRTFGFGLKPKYEARYTGEGALSRHTGGLKALGQSAKALAKEQNVWMSTRKLSIVAETQATPLPQADAGKYRLFSKCPLFRNLDEVDELVILLTDIMEIKNYMPASPIFNPGDVDDGMYCVLAGEVQLYDKSYSLLGSVGPGETFGERGVIHAPQVRLLPSSTGRVEAASKASEVDLAVRLVDYLDENATPPKRNEKTDDGWEIGSYWSSLVGPNPDQTIKDAVQAALKDRPTATKVYEDALACLERKCAAGTFMWCVWRAYGRLLCKESEQMTRTQAVKCRTQYEQGVRRIVEQCKRCMRRTYRCMLCKRPGEETPEDPDDVDSEHAVVPIDTESSLKRVRAARAQDSCILAKLPIDVMLLLCRHFPALEARRGYLRRQHFRLWAKGTTLPMQADPYEIWAKGEELVAFMAKAKKARQTRMRAWASVRFDHDE